VADQIKDLVLFGNDGCVWTPLLASLKTVRSLFLCCESTHEEITSLKIDYQLHNTIEYINDCPSYSVALQLLSTNICSMLTTLIVHDFSDDIIPWLGNAPALRRLKLSPESISFDDINGIHDDVPGLQHLEIIYAVITNDGFDDPIEPATSIVECVFFYVTEQLYQKTC
jgi:hypothetical protein